MAMIEKLTPEQEELLTTYRDIGLSEGLALGPTNRAAVIPVFKDLYTKILDMAEPKQFIFVRGPMEAQKVISVLTADKGNIHEKWTPETNDEFVDMIVSKFKKFTSFCDTHSFGMGSCESYWVQFYKYFRDVVGIKYDTVANDGLNMFDTLVKNSGWHYLFEECVIVCDRATSIMTENGQLHNVEGPAVSFADGSNFWFINGHEVNEKIVMTPHELTIKEIKAESNNETKRIMIERYGVQEYLVETEARTIDSDKLSLEGSATRHLIEDNEGFRWLMCSDGSTGRMYFLPASNEANTCREAHEMMSGLSEDDILAEG